MPGEKRDRVRQIRLGKRRQVSGDEPALVEPAARTLQRATQLGKLTKLGHDYVVPRASRSPTRRAAGASVSPAPRSVREQRGQRSPARDHGQSRSSAQDLWNEGQAPHVLSTAEQKKG